MIGARKIALLALFGTMGLAQTLVPRLNDGQIVAAAPKFNFLEGKPLDRLRNGQSVTFDFQLQVFDGVRPLGRSLHRFVLSYDLWEETFSAVHLSQAMPRTPVSTASRLKGDAVAGWCLGQMRLPLPNVEKTRPLTLQLEVRTAGLRIPNPIRPQGSVDLGVLVEIFSRPPDPKESRYTAMSRSFTLAGLETP